jgi:hypothetical protein
MSQPPTILRIKCCVSESLRIARAAWKQLKCRKTEVIDLPHIIRKTRYPQIAEEAWQMFDAQAAANEELCKIANETCSKLVAQEANAIVGERIGRDIS